MQKNNVLEPDVFHKITEKFMKNPHMSLAQDIDGPFMVLDPDSGQLLAAVQKVKVVLCTFVDPMDNVGTAQKTKEHES